MKQQYAPVSGRKTLERGCALAESRLQYLTELFESGRWRRFHSEMDLLDNIREAKTAVETWRRLARSEASHTHAVDRSRAEHRPAVPLPQAAAVLYEQPRKVATPPPAQRAAAAPEVDLPPIAPWHRSPDLAAAQDRDPVLSYPILHNAM